MGQKKRIEMWVYCGKKYPTVASREDRQHFGAIMRHIGLSMVSQ